MVLVGYVRFRTSARAPLSFWPDSEISITATLVIVTRYSEIQWDEEYKSNDALA